MFGAWAYAQDIQLNPGWNAVSTPAYLSNLTFSNGWEWISFITLKDWSWISVPATVDNIKPLDGFMVYNANSSTVTLTLDYKTNPTPAESIWQKQLSRWWNLLWITTTDDPFNGIDATMYVDPTIGWRYTVSNWIINPELGEAYFVFVSDGSIYGWVNAIEEEAWADESIQEPTINVWYIKAWWHWLDETMFRFHVDEPLTWLVLFSNSWALNDPTTIQSWDILTIEDKPKSQMIQAIWYWCPINPKSVDDCNIQIKKSNTPEAFIINGYDAKVFYMKK